MIVLAPYGVAAVLVFAIFWAIEGVDGSDNHQQQPGNDGKDFVGNEVAPREFFPFDERIV